MRENKGINQESIERYIRTTIYGIRRRSINRGHIDGASRLMDYWLGIMTVAFIQSNSYRDYRSTAIGMLPTAYHRMGEVQHGTMKDEQMNSLSGAPFDAAHYGDGSGINYGQPGAIVKDNNGCIEYLATATSGNYGGAYDFSTSLRSNTDMTLMYWVQIPSVGNVPAIRLGAGSHFNYRLYTNETSIRWDQHDGSATRTLSVSTTQTPGVWYHVAGVRQTNGLDVELFKNGVSIGSTTLGGVSTTTNQGQYRIGSLTASAQKAIGFADEMKLFHRALTATEIKTIYLAGRDGVTQ